MCQALIFESARMDMKRRHSKAKVNMVAEGPLDSHGLRLQNMRCLRSTTQLSLAEQLGVGQTALSHMERRDDILLSTLRAYVEALGGQLHVAATFPEAEPISLVGRSGWQPTMNGSAVPGAADEFQLCLPNILGPDQIPPSRDVIFSIRPAHAEKILDGTKTVELRRRF